MDKLAFPLEMGLALTILKQLLNGLVYVHEKGITHRDLSIANIFLDVDRNVKIGDFGLGKFPYNAFGCNLGI